MTEITTQLAIAIVVFLAIDMVWLVIVARGFYKSQLGPLMAEKVNWPAALAFYLLYVFGIVVFAVQPADNAWQAAGLGAMLGLVAYGTYDLTNLATLRDWPALLVSVDLIWGAVLTASVSAVTYGAYGLIS